MGQELILRYGVVSFYGEKMRGRSLFKPKNVLLPMGCSVNLPPSLNRKIAITHLPPCDGDGFYKH